MIILNHGRSIDGVVAGIAHHRLRQVMFFTRSVEQSLFLELIQHLLIMLHRPAAFVLLVDLYGNIFDTVLVV